MTQPNPPMSDLYVRDSQSNAAEYTVSEISGALKRTVEDAFGHVRVRGEISGYRGPHSSGHAYFALKDDRAKIEAVIWRTAMARLKFKPEEGMEVIATGRLTTYPNRSSYQIVIEALEPAGAGALMALLEERKRRLAAEGLFEAGRKRSLPFMPCVIGVITSPTGAVIRDILHRIADRFPLHVLVWPVRVQGETTAAEVTRAVHGFNALAPDGRLRRPDVLIVARGGGSLEDLWGFNDEGLARAVAASAIPVISAVGHETDWTLIDLVADRRAPTPTGAAEMAVPVRAELEATLASLAARLSAAQSRAGERRRQALRAAGRGLPSADQLLALPRRRHDEAASRLARALEVSTRRSRARLAAMRLAPSLLARRVNEARKHLDRAAQQLPKCARAYLSGRRLRLAAADRRMTPEPVLQRARLAARDQQRLSVRLPRAMAALVAHHRRSLAQTERLLTTLSHQAVLERGFVLVSGRDGALLKRAADVSPGAALTLQFADGTAEAVAGGEARLRRPSRAAKATKVPAEQGSLF